MKRRTNPPILKLLQASQSTCRLGGAGVWRSIVVDAMPAGAYELKLKAKVTGDQPIRLKVAIEPSERSQGRSSRSERDDHSGDRI